MPRTIYEVQRDFALACGLRTEIIWDALSAEQSEILIEKIKTIIPDGNSNKKQNALQKMRQNLYQNVWQQRKYTNRTLLSAIVYVMVSDDLDPDLAKQSTRYSCHPVFRTRKCMNANNSAGCCMVFVDENARVYQNWGDYLNSNMLPQGTMIAPQNGIYTFDDNHEVVLECQLTPKSSKKSKLLSVADKAIGASGIVYAAAAATFTLPVAGPAMIAATAFAASTAAYTTVRSAMQLNDRRSHGQSNALTEPDARNNWLGVAGGVVGLGATGATSAIKYAADAGREISMISKIAVGINVSSILLSGTGVVNGVYDIYLKYNDNDEISMKDFLQLGSSLLIFTHSINNVNMLSKISARNRGITVRRQLGSQIREMFEKISREVIKLNGNAGRTDLIRTLNDIPQTLGTLHEVHSNLGSGSALIENGMQILATIFPKLAGIKYLAEYGTKFIEHITNAHSLLDVLATLQQFFCERGVRFVLNLTQTFINENIDSIESALNTFVPTESVMHKIFMQCVTKYQNLSYEYLEGKTCEILNELERYFSSLNPISEANLKHECKTCSGYYYICDI